VYGRYIEAVNWVYKSTNGTVGAHLVLEKKGYVSDFTNNKRYFIKHHGHIIWLNYNIS